MQSLETALLAQARRRLRTLLAVPSARAGGLACVEDLAIPGRPARCRPANVRAFVAALRRVNVRAIEKKYPILMHGGLNFTAYSKLAISALQDVGELARTQLRG